MDVGRNARTVRQASFAVGFTTMLRPECAGRFVQSVREFYPDIAIYAVVQSDDPDDLLDLEAFGVTRILAPHDTGLAASRNLLIEQVAEDYILLAEDDFVIRAPLPINAALHLFGEEEDAIFVGGHVVDYVHESDGCFTPKPVRRDKNLAIDTISGGVVIVPRDVVGGPEIEHMGHRFQQCDYVGNWGLIKRAFFIETGFRWRSEFKISGEHLDFFVRRKLQHPDKKIFFMEDFEVDHLRERNEAYTKLRSREEFRRQIEGVGISYEISITDATLRFFADGEVISLLPEKKTRTITELRARVALLDEKYQGAKADGRAAWTKLNAKFSALKEENSRLRLQIDTMKGDTNSPTAQ
jgi:hypothetical protein